MSHRPLGPYIIEKRLATGGMAEVYVARKTGPHGFSKRVALKRILPQHTGDPDFVSMFIDEARLAAQLEHPNIVQIFDFGEQRGELFITMELVVGSNVNRLLRALTSRRQAIPLDLALHIVSQTSHALAYAHRLRGDGGESLGVVHRDVSPANIFLTSTGHVKLGDFGIARMAGRDARTDDGQVRGKLGYMSPEQVTGRKLDGRSDIFTLATVFAEMLIGEPLFGTGNDLEILLRIRDGDTAPLDHTKRRVPHDVLRLIRAGLETDPEARPTAASYTAMVDDVIRKRGIVRGPDRLARMLMRLGLVRGASEEEEEPKASEVAASSPTHFLDTNSLEADFDPTTNIEAGGVASPISYRVRMTDGSTMGPLPFPELVQMITSGEVDDRAQVAKEHGDFVGAATLPEFSRFVTSPALRWRPEDMDHATRQGGLQPAKLLSVVHNIAIQHETGVLHLSDRDRRKKIYFVEGRPEFVGSNDKNELLGAYLVEKGYCLRMEVDMALALLPRYEGRLGDALVGLGVLRPVQLFRAVSEQVRSRYLEAFRWRTGEWAYVPDERSQEETIPFDHDNCELQRDACLEAHPDELLAALEPVRERVLYRTSAPPRPLESYRVPGPWREVLAVDGDATFSSLLAKHASRGMEPEDVYRAIYLGISCDLVEAA